MKTWTKLKSIEMLANFDLEKAEKEIMSFTEEEITELEDFGNSLLLAAKQIRELKEESPYDNSSQKS